MAQDIIDSPRLNFVELIKFCRLQTEGSTPQPTPEDRNSTAKCDVGISVFSDWASI
jgi:hypothetical protein